MAYIALQGTYPVFMALKDAKVTLTNDTNYSCHIKPYNLFNQSYKVYITPLVINPLRPKYILKKFQNQLVQ